MQASHVTVTHTGPVVQITGTFPSTVPGLLSRTGAIERDGSWWCTTAEWKRIESILRAMGVPMQVVGEPAAPIVIEPAQQRHVIMSMYGTQVRLQGDLPKYMRKEWLGSERVNGHVGMSPWALPDFINECESARIRVELTAQAQELLDEVKERIRAVDEAMAMTTEQLPNVALRTGSLRDYQRIALAFGKACKGQFFIGDEVGVGKTVEAIGWKRLTGSTRNVLICPSSAKDQWKDEIQKFDGGRSLIIDGYANHAPDLTNVCWVITSMDTLADKSTRNGVYRGWLNTLRNWKPTQVFVDESHRARGRDADRSKAIRLLCHSSPHRTPMTGTAMANTPMDLWAQLDAVQPGWWGTWFEFGMAFGGGQQKYAWRGKKKVMYWDMNGVSRPEILAKRLRYVMIRRTKQEVKLELPSQTRVPYHMALSPAFRTQYDAAQQEYRTFVASLVSENSSDEERDRALEMSKGARMRFNLKLRQISSRGRCDGAVDHATSLIEQGRNPLIFAFFTESLHAIRDGLRENGLRVGFIDGSTPRDRRDEQRKAFHAKRLDVMVGQTEAMGVALNFQDASDTSATHDLTHLPLDIIQTEGRIYRSGQENPVTHYYYLGQDTKDEKVLNILLKKMGTIDAVYSGTDFEKDYLRAMESDFFRG